MALGNRKRVKRLMSDVKSYKKELHGVLLRYSKATELLRKAVKGYTSAEKSYSARSNAKNEKKLALASAEVDTNLLSCNDIFTEIMGNYRTIISLYDEIAQLYIDTPKKQLRYNKECDDFIVKFDGMIYSANKGLGEFVPRENTSGVQDILDYTEQGEGPADSEAASADVGSAQPETRTVTSTASMASVSVAPVTIDVTPIVERAINATMDKLISDMERKISEYISNLNLPKAPVSAAATGDIVKNTSAASEAVNAEIKANVELEAHLLEEERHVFDKLKAMCASVQEVLEGLGDISGAYMTLAAKQKELAELQKQTNDMQRYTLREQQGIQVNQKVISKDQAELAGEQSVVVDKHKAALEAHRAALEAQSSLAESQAAVTETQAALEAAMKEVMQVQKELISAQQGIIQGNLKNQDAQKVIADKQNELAASQKELLAEQKQALKEHKALAERQRAAQARVTASKSAADKPAAKSAAKSTAKKPARNEKIEAELEAKEQIVEGAVKVSKPTKEEGPDLETLSAKDEFGK